MTLAEDQERETERVQVKRWVDELYDELSRCANKIDNKYSTDDLATG
jgi:hypothetical protein